MATAAGERVFLRKASGLIKTASSTDVFIYDLGLISIGIGLGGLLYFGPAIYPGGSLSIGMLIAAAAMLCVGLGMLSWTLTLPRSGGIYVFGTRSMWPPLAFTLSFVEASAWLFYCAVAAFWIMTIGVAPMIAAIGIISGSPGLEDVAATLTEGWVVFLIGTGILIIAGSILASGMRRYFFSQKLMIGLAAIGTITFLAVLLTSSRDEFVSTFNSLMAGRLDVGEDAYGGVISAANAAGYDTDAGFSWSQTLLSSNWAFLPLIGAAFSIAIGGEIKQASRGQSVGIFGAIAVAVIVWIVSFVLVFRVIGYDFLGAVGFATLEGVEGAATPVEPWITLLTAILSNSVWLTVLISLGFIAWIWLWIPGMIGYANRAIMAWSLDRVAPDALGKVSERTHTPVPAIALATTVAVVFLALFSFTEYFITVIFIELAVLAWAIVLVAGIFFPWRRRDLYEKGPVSSKRVFGLPAMTVACTLGAIAAIAYFFNLFFDDFAAGHSWRSLGVLIGWFVGGFVIYFVMRTIRRRQGVNVDLAFKEIPVE